MDNHNIPKGFYTVSSSSHNLLTGPHNSLDDALRARQLGDNSCVLYNDEPLIGWGPWASSSPIIDEVEVREYNEALRVNFGDQAVAEKVTSDKSKQKIDPK